MSSGEPASGFTPLAHRALAFARTEADRLHHNCVGTEHLLLGLIDLGQGTAVAVLARMGFDLANVRAEVEKQVGLGPDQQWIDDNPYSPRAQNVLALAATEAKALNHACVGTEHIFLGLLREEDGVAARVFASLDLDITKTRQQIFAELAPKRPANGAEATANSLSTLATVPVPSQNGASATVPKFVRDPVDTGKRYDIHCAEPNQTVRVHRNVLIKGVKSLFQGNQHDPASEFVELERSDGQTLWIVKSSILRFCEHNPHSSSDNVTGSL